ncbi:phosphoribosyltransferase-like protein [Paraburkholderia aspalathi]|uniref:phosphoribosyltransferase-like protein n=1 Tax=Paraburkholderia aspalathi TaxID=1324617 RepID=UPI0038BC65C6
MSQIPQLGGFDQLGVERAVHALSRSNVRSPLSVERIKVWVKQFVSDEEKTLAWLILRNLIFRTSEQLQSSMRQALKQAALHFLDETGQRETVAWTDALNGAAGLDFYCGPPSVVLYGMAKPGKSGDVIARAINQRYGIAKLFPSDVTELSEKERFIVVDDGTYTGVQLVNFLRSWDRDYSNGRVAMAVGMAHQTACDHLRAQFPKVPLFHGELLTPETCFATLAQKWIETQQWKYDKSPHEVYAAVHNRAGPFKEGSGGNGYGDIGALVAFSHGVPDDSIQLLWGVSESWKPLVER